MKFSILGGDQVGTPGANDLAAERRFFGAQYPEDHAPVALPIFGSVAAGVDWRGQQVRAASLATSKRQRRNHRQVIRRKTKIPPVGENAVLQHVDA